MSRGVTLGNAKIISTSSDIVEFPSCPNENDAWIDSSSGRFYVYHGVDSGWVEYTDLIEDFVSQYPNITRDFIIEVIVDANNLTFI